MPDALLGPRLLIDRVPFDARRLDALECVASELLAIGFSHLIGARNVSWAAFAGFMVMRGHVLETFMRSVLRMVGTVSGGALALLAVPLVASRPAVASLVLVAVGLPTLYAALTARRAYAWLFVGLTFAMVVFDHLQDPGVEALTFMRTRVLETIAGTTACLIVSLFTTLTLRRRWPATRVSPPRWLGWNGDAFRHAAQGTVALAILPWIGLLGVRELAQAAITVMTAMLVPVTGIGTSGLRPVTRRLWHRVVGCIAGAAFSAAFLFASSGTAWVLLLGTALAVLIGRLIENGGRNTAYVGTQFVLAALMVLVPDGYADAAVAPGLARLGGILIGMAILEPVLLAWHLVPRARHRRGEDATSDAGGV